MTDTRGVDSTESWTAEKLLALGRSYQGAAVLAAAAELDVFSSLLSKPLSASELAAAKRWDDRSLVILLDALAALGLLIKSGLSYSLPPGLDAFLSAQGSQSVLAMAQHQANCLRNWGQLARVVATGRPAEHIPSVRGESGDREAFIGAMHNVSAPYAASVIRAVQPLEFTRLLDVGGASGTWTEAFLQACSQAQATLFDLPSVIPLARSRLTEAGVAHRVQFAGGDFLKDPLPMGADLAWVSAIVHQNSREQNRLLFAKVFGALRAGGRLGIRDIVMDESRTQPVAGALFAVNMLVATEGGGTFTFRELCEDLESANFTGVALARQDEGMNSVVVARKPD